MVLTSIQIWRIAKDSKIQLGGKIRIQSRDESSRWWILDNICILVRSIIFITNIFVWNLNFEIQFKKNLIMKKY